MVLRYEGQDSFSGFVSLEEGHSHAFYLKDTKTACSKAFVAVQQVIMRIFRLFAIYTLNALLLP